jgi:hypothetical protein
MKYLWLIVCIVVLIPSPIHAQNPQFVNCRTLEDTGRFIGSDEILVDGLVCKVAKPKKNPTISGMTEDADKPKGLSVIRPQVLQPNTTADANPAVGVPTPEKAPDPKTASGPGEPFFQLAPSGSLADVARANRKNSQRRTAVGQEAVALGHKTTIASAPIAPPMTAPRSEKATISMTAAKEPQIQSTAEVTPPAPVAISVKPAGSQQAANAKRITALPSRPSNANSKVSTANVAQPSVVPTDLLQAAGTEISAARQTPGLAKLASAEATPATTVKPPPSSAQLAQGAAAISIDSPTSEQGQPARRRMLTIPETSLTVINEPIHGDSYAIAADIDFTDGQHPGCAKNVSLASLEKEKLFLAIPEWAAEWYEKNQAKFPGLCFSNSLMPGAQNYLIVFYSAITHVPTIDAGSKTATSAGKSSVANVGTFTASYGTTWHYTYEETVTTTITSSSADKVPHNQPSNVLYARAYSEQGIPVAQHWAVVASKQSRETSAKPGKNRSTSFPAFHAADELLKQIAQDIARR